MIPALVTVDADQLAAARDALTRATVEDAVAELDAQACALDERRDRRGHCSGRVWEDGHSCPDCFAFRSAGSGTCSRCGSYARPVPTHEVQTSAVQKARSRRRRASRR